MLRDRRLADSHRVRDASAHHPSGKQLQRLRLPWGQFGPSNRQEAGSFHLFRPVEPGEKQADCRLDPPEISVGHYHVGRILRAEGDGPDVPWVRSSSKADDRPMAGVTHEVCEGALGWVVLRPGPVRRSPVKRGGRRDRMADDEVRRQEPFRHVIGQRLRWQRASKPERQRAAPTKGRDVDG